MSCRKESRSSRKETGICKANDQTGKQPSVALSLSSRECFVVGLLSIDAFRVASTRQTDGLLFVITIHSDRPALPDCCLHIEMGKLVRLELYSKGYPQSWGNRPSF